MSKLLKKHSCLLS